MHRLNLISAHLQSSGAFSRSTNDNFIKCELNLDDRVAVLTLADMKTLNSLNEDRVMQLNKRLEELERNPSVNVIVITGLGRAFSVGAHMKTIKGLKHPEVMRSDPYERTWYRLLPRYKKVLIAAVNGYCFGGGFELALMCDIIIASDDAKFGFPEIKLGLMPGVGGTQKLVREIGKNKAMEHILTGEVFTARDAKDKMGLISRVVAIDRAKAEAMKLGKRIADRLCVATSATKQALLLGYELPLSQGSIMGRNLLRSLLVGQQLEKSNKAEENSERVVFSDIYY